MWRQQAVLGLLPVPSRAVRHLVMLSGEPPTPDLALSLQRLQLSGGSSLVLLQRNQLLSTHLPCPPGSSWEFSPLTIQLFRNSCSRMHLPSPFPPSFKSIIIRFSEWIPGPFPYPHPHLWSVLCHLASLLAEQSLSI